MEVIVLLKLEVDAEKLKKDNDTDDHIKSKIRAYVADIVGNAIDAQETITMLNSSIATEIEPKETIQIIPSDTNAT